MALYNPSTSPFTVSARDFKRRFGCRPTARHIRRRQICEEDVRELWQSLTAERERGEWLLGLAVDAAMADAGVKPASDSERYAVGKAILDDAARRRRRAVAIAVAVAALAAIGWVGRSMGVL